MDTTMNDTLKHEEALFIPSEVSESEDYVPKVAGSYHGHITGVRTVTREFTNNGRTFKARIFNFKVHVAPENVNNHYTLSDGREITGEHYIDWDVVADGVFRFLEPTDSDTFESNTVGNRRYLRFCESLGMEIPTEDRTIGGKTVKVQVLPDIEEDKLNGTPVIAVVVRGDDWVDRDDGKTKPSWKVKYTKLWKDGKRVVVETTTKHNDLPF